MANVPQWDPPEGMFLLLEAYSLHYFPQRRKLIHVYLLTEQRQVKAEDGTTEQKPPVEQKFDRLSFSNFDISQVLQNGKLLLGSAGKEYDLDLSDLDPAERLAIQRKNLAANLGLTSQFMDGRTMVHSL